MKILRFLALTAALLMGAASAFAVVPSFPSGASNFTGDIAPIGWDNQNSLWRYWTVDPLNNLQTTIGDTAIPTFAVSQAGLAITASTDVLVIEAGTTKTTMIKRIIVFPGFATASGVATLTISRNTVAASTAGTLVTSATAQRFTTDTAFSGIMRVGAFTHAGTTTVATQILIPLPTSASTTVGAAPPFIYDLTNEGSTEGMKIPPGVTNGVMFTHSGLAGGTGFYILVEFTER